ncbi:MAG: hypothetical protein COV44_00480 [Deltaproteobacteria bacterium CG11_big_fil_rev_8_21_14_0_20_45_16]|nr:MAG: hypothetical protein COV44_00480 [Deltaproteobacteria bacterium CG11_big_fil_rev_8_21_14_0_20_45_16]
MRSKFCDFKRTKRKASALPFVLGVILIVGIMIAYVLKISRNTKTLSSADIKKIALSQGLDEAFQYVQKRTLKSIQYFGAVKAQLGEPEAETRFAAYRDKLTYDLFLSDENNIAINGEEFNLAEDFIDWAREAGYRADAVTKSGDVHYSFSVRCLKKVTGSDGDPNNPDSPGYWTGEYDGCPLNSDTYPRTSWQLKDWTYLPKKIEIKIRAEKDGIVQTLREVAEVHPVSLSDYSLALGNIPTPDCENPFQLFGNHYFGRVHFNSPDIICDDGNQYYIRLDSRKNSFHAWRPFTTSGLKVAEIENLNYYEDHPGCEPSCAPPAPEFEDAEPVIFHSGYSTDTEPIGGSQGIMGQIQASVAEVATYAQDPENSPYPIIKITSNGCNIKFSVSGGGEGKVTVSDCSDAVVTNLLTDRATAIYATKPVQISGDNIVKGKVGIYATGNVFLAGSIRYADASTDKVFMPGFDPLTYQDPTAQGSVTEGVPALNENQTSGAMIVTTGYLVYDPYSATGLKSSLGNPVDGGRVYNGSTGNTIFGLQSEDEEIPVSSFAEAGSNDFFNSRVAFIDAKIQTKSFVIRGLVDAPNDYGGGSGGKGEFSFHEIQDQPPLEPLMNLGILVARGGLTMQEANPLKKMYTNPRDGGSCTNGCIEGFNYSIFLFDDRRFFNDFPGVIDVDNQAEWLSLSHDRLSDSDLFGLTDQQWH